MALQKQFWRFKYKEWPNSNILYLVEVQLFLSLNIYYQPTENYTLLVDFLQTLFSILLENGSNDFLHKLLLQVFSLLLYLRFFCFILNSVLIGVGHKNYYLSIVWILMDVTCKVIRGWYKTTSIAAVGCLLDEFWSHGYIWYKLFESAL